MAKWIHSACPKCSSSDAFSYKEGNVFAFCFSCGKSSPVDPNAKIKSTQKEEYDVHTLEEIAEYDSRGFKERQITKTVASHYGVKVSYNEDGTIHSHFYPYTKKGKIVAYKERQLPKKFFVHGKFDGVELFGQNVSNGNKRLIITEGEIDCMAVAQAQFEKYNKFFPVVAISSAAVKQAIINSREWIRGFEEVVLMFDNDEAGQKAQEEAAKIIGYDKVKIASLPEKDASDVLLKHGSEVLMDCVFRATSYSPAGIIRGEEVWVHFKLRQDTVSLPYPKCLQGLNDRIDGLRLGEIALFTSGTGSGKSTVIKEIIMEILETTDSQVGVVSLEESIGDTAEKFINMKLKKVGDDAKKASDKEKRKAFDDIFADERLVLLDHQGSVSDDSLTDKIEQLAVIGCKHIILDHITIAVSEGANGKTGNEAIDSFMSDLLKIVKKHNIWLCVVSHLRKGEKPFEEGHMPSMDDIKGSGSIKQISFDIIAFCRNMVAEDPIERNTIKLRVLKSRYNGNTGNAGCTKYNPKTGRLAFSNVVDFEE